MPAADARPQGQPASTDAGVPKEDGEDMEVDASGGGSMGGLSALRCTPGLLGLRLGQDSEE